MCVASVTAVEDIRCWYIYFFTHIVGENWLFVFASAFVVMFVEYSGRLCGPESLHTVWKTEIAEPDKFRISSVFSFSVLNWTEWIQFGKCSWGRNLVFSERRTNVVTIQERSLTIFKIKWENRRDLVGKCYSVDTETIEFQQKINPARDFFSADKGIECKSTSSSTLKTLDQFLG